MFLLNDHLRKIYWEEQDLAVCKELSTHYATHCPCRPHEATRPFGAWHGTMPSGLIGSAGRSKRPGEERRSILRGTMPGSVFGARPALCGPSSGTGVDSRRRLRIGDCGRCISNLYLGGGRVCELRVPLHGRNLFSNRSCRDRKLEFRPVTHTCVWRSHCLTFSGKRQVRK